MRLLCRSLVCGGGLQSLQLSGRRASCSAMRQFKRYDSPTGVMGFGDLGVMRVGRVDPDVEKLLMPFRKMGFA
jgi:hypothetical protein